MSWLRRNRVGLALLPIAAAAAFAANGARIALNWYPNDFHVPMTPDRSGVVQVVDGVENGDIRYPIRPKVSLVSVDQTETVSQTVDGRAAPATIPPGTTLWRVVIHIEADPNMVLRNCQLALTDGNSVWNSAVRSYATKALQPTSPCQPGVKAGPKYEDAATGPVVDAEDVRPAAFDAVSYVVTPSNVRPTEVRLWWNLPRYAALPITSLG